MKYLPPLILLLSSSALADFPEPRIKGDFCPRWRAASPAEKWEAVEDALANLRADPEGVEMVIECFSLHMEVVLDALEQACSESDYHRSEVVDILFEALDECLWED